MTLPTWGMRRRFVWVDTLARVLHTDGTEVIVCRNVTDVDDVLLAAAGRSGSRYDEFAVIQQFYFDQDMTALGVRQPAVQPRAHAYIGQVIAARAKCWTTRCGPGVAPAPGWNWGPPAPSSRRGVPGEGPVVLSMLAVADDLAAGRLVAVATEGIDLTRSLRAVWIKGRSLTPLAQRLLRVATS
jgi:tRNA synthetases class I (C) catalytic domain